MGRIESRLKRLELALHVGVVTKKCWSCGHLKMNGDSGRLGMWVMLTSKENPTIHNCWCKVCCKKFRGVLDEQSRTLREVFETRVFPGV